MSLSDLDQNFVKSINSLHTHNVLYRGEKSDIQLSLEEAIKNKTGTTKDFSELISLTHVDSRYEEYEHLTCAVEEFKPTSSSDNELELDLLKEDLMCIVCHGMDVGARNRLLECSDCHFLYHQECHRPVVTTQDADNTWICQNCKLKESPVDRGVVIMTPAPSTSKVAVPKSLSPPHRSSVTSNPLPVNYKSSGIKTSSTSKPTSSQYNKSSSKPSSSSSSSSRNITPNINIISADKRVQIMRKKAAKQQEKRKLPR